VNCEMCHGPSAAHVAAMRAGRPYNKNADERPVDFQDISSTEYVAICSQCHMQSVERLPVEGDGTVNYSAAGERFDRTLSSRALIDYQCKPFYKDGRFRETVFIGESFVLGMFPQRWATCGNCHNPQPADAADNPRSLKFGADSDRMCLGCHVQFQAAREAHTHHSPASEASGCVSCHMPRIKNALLCKARSHQIDDIPDAEMAARFGPAASLNACLMCHQDRVTAWFSARLKTWKTVRQSFVEASIR